VWTVVYIAPSQEEANRLERLLSAEGFLIKLRPFGSTPAGVASSIEVLVPESEVNEALEVINAL
jgi:hypothetical protein